MVEIRLSKRGKFRFKLCEILGWKLILVKKWKCRFKLRGLRRGGRTANEADRYGRSCCTAASVVRYDGKRQHERDRSREAADTGDRDPLRPPSLGDHRPAVPSSRLHGAEVRQLRLPPGRVRAAVGRLAVRTGDAAGGRRMLRSDDPGGARLGSGTRRSPKPHRDYDKSSNLQLASCRLQDETCTKSCKTCTSLVGLLASLPCNLRLLSCKF